MKLLYSVSFAEQYGLNPSDYSSIDISTCDFPARTKTRLKSLDIHTVADLINNTPKKYLGVPGMGKYCVNQIDSFVSKLVETAPPVQATPSGQKKINIDGLLSISQQILAGDYSFIQDGGAYPRRFLDHILRYKTAFEDLGEDFVKLCVEQPKHVSAIISSFRTFYVENARTKEVKALILALSSARCGSSAMGLVNIFTQDMNKRQVLISQFPDENALISMVDTGNLNDDKVYLLLKEFLVWCRFDIREDIQRILSTVYKVKNAKTVISMRARNKTLEETGNDIHVTRERVWQVEVKAIRKFSDCCDYCQIVPKIAAEKIGASIITAADIAHYCEDDAVELGFLFRKARSSTYVYDSQNEVFVIGNSL